MQKGFTLIEFLIYIALVAVVLVLVSGFAWNIIYGSEKSMAYREIQQNGRFAMEKITRAIRNRDPISGFTVSDYVLYQNGTALTTGQVKITNLEFTSINNSIKIDLSLEYNNISGRSEYFASLDLESTAVPRQ